MDDGYKGTVEMELVVDTGRAKDALRTTEEDAERTDEAVEGLLESEDELVMGTVDVISSMAETDAKCEETKEGLEELREKQELVAMDSVRTATMLMSLFSGINNVIGAFGNLIPMSDEARESFVKLQAAVQAITGTIQILKSLKAMVDLTNASMQRAAVSGIVAAVASNPLKALAAGAAVGVAAGAVTAYFLTQNVNNNYNTGEAAVKREVSSSDIVGKTYTGGYY